MRTTIRVITIALLLFNSISALVGGWTLMNDPSGTALGFPTGWLRYSPFPDFLIPGIVLFVAIGLFSSFTAFLAMTKAKRYPYFVMAQGIILLGWLFFQLTFTKMGSLLQLLYGHVGLFLVVAGIFLSILEGYEFRLRLKRKHQLA